MFNKVIEWGYEGKNPAVYIKKLKQKSQDGYFLPEEMPTFYLGEFNKKELKKMDYCCYARKYKAKKNKLFGCFLSKNYTVKGVIMQ